MTTVTRRPIIIIAIVAVGASLAGCGSHEIEHAEADLTPVSASVESVQRIAEEKPIEVRGIVQPARQSFVSSRVMGPVIDVKVNAGAIVASGQALIEIQPETSEGQLAQAEGALAQARAALALAERNFKRFETLHTESAASDLELDMARMQHEQARGAVEQAEGAVRAASSVASESVVRAPFAGRVVDTLVEVGDLAAPGRPLVRVESRGGQQIWLDVRAEDIRRLAIGDPLMVRLDARPDLGVVPGTVREIVPSADPATHTFTVKAGLGDLQVASGLSGRASIIGDVTNRLVVPATAVHSRGGLELVVVRDADGTARTRAVTTGSEVAGGRVEILSGLSEGDEVAIDLAAPVADGTPLERAS
jgi:RND family efflux transporter MFP subunit